MNAFHERLPFPSTSPRTALAETTADDSILMKEAISGHQWPSVGTDDHADDSILAVSISSSDAFRDAACRLRASAIRTRRTIPPVIAQLIVSIAPWAAEAAGTAAEGAAAEGAVPEIVAEEAADEEAEAEDRDTRSLAVAGALTVRLCMHRGTAARAISSRSARSAAASFACVSAIEASRSLIIRRCSVTKAKIWPWK